MLLTVGSGYLARAGMHYSDTMSDDVRGNAYYCDGCSGGSNEQLVNAYVGSIQGKMQAGLQNMIHHAGVGDWLFNGVFQVVQKRLASP